jgi:hypothetical protein
MAVPAAHDLNQRTALAGRMTGRSSVTLGSRIWTSAAVARAYRLGNLDNHISTVQRHREVDTAACFGRLLMTNQESCFSQRLASIASIAFWIHREET